MATGDSRSLLQTPGLCQLVATHHARTAPRIWLRVSPAAQRFRRRRSRRSQRDATPDTSSSGAAGTEGMGVEPWLGRCGWDGGLKLWVSQGGGWASGISCRRLRYAGHRWRTPTVGAMGDISPRSSPDRRSWLRAWSNRFEGQSIGRGAGSAGWSLPGSVRRPTFRARSRHAVRADVGVEAAGGRPRTSWNAYGTDS